MVERELLRQITRPEGRSRGGTGRGVSRPRAPLTAFEASNAPLVGIHGCASKHCAKVRTEGQQY
eukprot:116350-Prymnesium_polylepis.1